MKTATKTLAALFCLFMIVAGPALAADDDGGFGSSYFAAENHPGFKDHLQNADDVAGIEPAAGDENSADNQDSAAAPEQADDSDDADAALDL